MMAIIDDIRKKDKDIRANTHTVMDYNFDENYYSIWTYKSGDVDGEYGTKQSLQFDKKIAKKLIRTLQDFVNN